MSGFTSINVGTTANDGTGDSLRASQQAVNSNFLTAVRTLSAVADLSTEAAASGYSRIVQDIERGGLFKAVNGGSSDNVDIFTSATVGWTWQRVRGSWIDIASAGALGDDSTDNYSAIQAVLDRLETLGGGVCYIPHGTFRFSAQLLIASNCAIVGGGYSSILKFTGTTLGDHPDYYAIANKNRAHQRYIDSNGEATQNTGSLLAGEHFVNDENISLENFQLTGDTITNTEYISNTFTFTGTTVTDSASQFLAKGFSTNQKLYVTTASGGNAGAYNIDSVTASTITISGNTFDDDSGSERRLVGFRHRGGIFLGRVERPRIENVWINNAVNFAWNIYCWGPNKQINGNKINCNGEVAEDGIHCFGKGSIVTNNKVDVGDDIVIIASTEYEKGGEAFISNIDGNSEYGYLSIISSYSAVEDVFVSNSRFNCGKQRNGVFRLRFLNETAATDIQRITMRGVEFKQDEDGVHTGNNVLAFDCQGGVELDLDFILRNPKTSSSFGSILFKNTLRSRAKIRLLSPQAYREFGIKVENCDELKIHDSIFEDSAVLIADSTNIEFEGNRLPDIPSGSSPFEITGSSSNIVINDNSTNGPTTYNYGVTIEDTVTNLTVTGNKFTGAGQAVNASSGDISGSSFIQDNAPVMQSATISSGALNANGSTYIEVNGEGGLADSLININRAQTAQFLTIKKAADSGTITVSNSGNIDVGSSRTLNDTSKYILLWFDGSNWKEIVNGS